MEKKTKSDLLETAKKLHKEGHTNLHATHDGYFFTDANLAKQHARDIEGDVYKFEPSDLCEETSIMGEYIETNPGKEDGPDKEEQVENIPESVPEVVPETIAEEPAKIEEPKQEESKKK
jgi:hypothetical protein